jgi:hypothetical protein
MSRAAFSFDRFGKIDILHSGRETRRRGSRI